LSGIGNPSVAPEPGTLQMRLKSPLGAKGRRKQCEPYLRRLRWKQLSKPEK
jgi:hypothetical protein